MGLETEKDNFSGRNIKKELLQKYINEQNQEFSIKQIQPVDIPIQSDSIEMQLVSSQNQTKLVDQSTSNYPQNKINFINISQPGNTPIQFDSMKDLPLFSSQNQTNFINDLKPNNTLVQSDSLKEPRLVSSQNQTNLVDPSTIIYPQDKMNFINILQPGNTPIQSDSLKDLPLFSSQNQTNFINDLKPNNTLVQSDSLKEPRLVSSQNQKNLVNHSLIIYPQNQPNLINQLQAVKTLSKTDSVCKLEPVINFDQKVRKRQQNHMLKNCLRERDQASDAEPLEKKIKNKRKNLNNQKIIQKIVMNGKNNKVATEGKITEKIKIYPTYVRNIDLKNLKLQKISFSSAELQKFQFDHLFACFGSLFLKNLVVFHSLLFFFGKELFVCSGWCDIMVG